MTAVYKVDCSSPVADKVFQLQDFVEYLQKKMKVNKLVNNLANKVSIEAQDGNKIAVTANVKYSKRAVRYYARKFLQKQGFHERYRVISTAKDTYELRTYGATNKE